MDNGASLRILHIGNTAGVASILAKYMDKKFQTLNDVIIPKIADPFGCTTSGELYDCSVSLFKAKSVWRARRYDIIHTHSLEGIGRFIKKIYPSKKIVMHFHGSDIRGKWQKKERYWKKVDAVIVSTHDLVIGAPSSAIYLPNPIDTELFYPKRKPIDGTVFTLSYNADDLVKRIAQRFGLELAIHNSFQNPIPHNRFADVLSKYEYYLDVRKVDGNIVCCTSKTALEALACGCKVITWDGNVIKGLPEQHKPENVVSTLYDIYCRISQGMGN